MNGKSQQKSISKVSQINTAMYIAEVLFLLLLGVLAITLRAKIRIPFQIPGHHGIEVMALLFIGRSFSRIKFSTLISTVAAGSFILIPFLGFKDPFMPLIYIGLGFVIDIIFNSKKEWQNSILLMALIGGIAYMFIPLSRMIIHFTTGFPYSLFIKHGYVLPVVSHFLFGGIGALLGSGIALSIKKRK